MPFIKYIEKRFHSRALRLIQQANVIIKEYQQQGFTLTLRQLYYQFVSRDLLPNTMRSYKGLSVTISDGRLAGLIDWQAIEDRTRELRGKQHWETPGDLIKAAANSYHIDRWADQECRPEVWIEKDALLGPFENVCRGLDVDYFSCRGYTSQSEMWEASQRLVRRYDKTGQKTVILHFGDHDPSGMDMSRDIEDRINMFAEGQGEDLLEFRRIALNRDQVSKYRPPPNPAKLTDSRATGYISKFGKKSWELDALSPQVLGDLVKENVIEVVNDVKAWERAERREAIGRKRIIKAGKNLK